MNQKLVICGAGIAGISAAYYISKLSDNCNVTIIDKFQPVSFTSSKSGENFRDYWPHPSMESLASHSIELMQSLKYEYGNNAFSMDFSGYHFVSNNVNNPIFKDEHSKDFKKKNKVDFNKVSIQSKYPYLDKSITKSVFITNAGHVDSISMANLMFNEAKKKGVKFVQSEILNLSRNISGYDITLNSEESLECDQIILAAGPFINRLANLLSINLPVWNTLQRKFIIPDPDGIIPMDMPFTIYADPQIINWENDEKQFLNSNESTKRFTEMMPGAIHIKPEGGGRIKMGWAFSDIQESPQWYINNDELFPEVVLRGASKFIPKLKKYSKNIPPPIIQYGGYYTRTKENWPLIGPTDDKNVFVIGALAGFGSMTACAAGELCAQYISDRKIPWYGSYFHPNRYVNAEMKKNLEDIELDGQL